MRIATGLVALMLVGCAQPDIGGEDTDLNTPVDSPADPADDTDVPSDTDRFRETDLPGDTDPLADTDPTGDTDPPIDTDPPDDSDTLVDTDPPDDSDTLVDTDPPDDSDTLVDTDPPDDSDTLVDTDPPDDSDTLVDTDVVSASTVIFSELHGASQQTHRYVELYNPGSTAVSLEGWRIRLFPPGNTTPSETTTLPANTVIGANARFVIAAQGVGFQSAFPGASYDLQGSFAVLYADGVASLILVSPDGTTVDVYGEPGNGASSPSWSYQGTTAARRVGANTPRTTWTASDWFIGASPSPGDPPETGDTDQPSETPKLIVSEVHGATNPNHRFIEIYNLNSTPVNLDGWRITRHDNGGSSTSASYQFGASVSLPGNGVLLIGATDFSTFYGVTPDIISSQIAAGDGNDAYRLLTPSGNTHDIYGEVGIDGFGRAWRYDDRAAARRSWVANPRSTWLADEWAIGEAPTPGFHPDTLVDTAPVPQPPAGDGGDGNVNVSAVFISEVYGGTATNERFVELYNASAVPVQLATWRLKRFNNDTLFDGLTLFNASDTIQPFSTYIIAQSFLGFQGRFGFAPNRTSSDIIGGGTHAYQLEDNQGRTVDIFGVVGSLPGPWGYVGTAAERSTATTVSSPSFNLSQWSFGLAPDPGAWPNVPPTDPGDTDAPGDTDPAAPTRPPGVFISELFDGGSNSSRFIELHNASAAAIAIADMEIRRYDAFGGVAASYVIAAGAPALASGATVVIPCNTFGFEQLYGFAPTLVQGPVACEQGANGFELRTPGPTRTVIDTFGAANGGAGVPWAYTAGVTRHDDVDAPIPQFDISEWVFDTPATPGVHPPPPTGDDTDLPIDTDLPVDTDLPIDTDLPDCPAPRPSAATLMITEVYGSVSGHRYVQITNTGLANHSGSGFSLVCIGTTGVASGSVTLPTSIAAGTSHVIAHNNLAFQAEFGSFANGVSASGICNTGTMSYQLRSGSTVLDAWGTGGNGAGTSWDITEAAARRSDCFATPTPTFSVGEWDIDVSPSPFSYY